MRLSSKLMSFSSSLAESQVPNSQTITNVTHSHYTTLPYKKATKIPCSLASITKIPPNTGSDNYVIKSHL